MQYSQIQSRNQAKDNLRCKADLSPVWWVLAQLTRIIPWSAKS